jgi:hypothetical protein
VLAIANKWPPGEDHLAARARDQLVGEPVVAHEACAPRRLREQPMRGAVEHHRVAPGKRLNQRVAEARRPAKIRRFTNHTVCLVDQQRA